jgi:hypothetical protein
MISFQPRPEFVSRKGHMCDIKPRRFQARMDLIFHSSGLHPLEQFRALPQPFLSANIGKERQFFGTGPKCHNVYAT